MRYKRAAFRPSPPKESRVTCDRLLFALLLAFCLQAPAIASASAERAERLGPIGSGGGKGILCDDGKIYLADTFDLVRSGKISGYESVDPGAVMASAAAYLDKLHPEKVFPHPFLSGEKVSFGWLVAHTNANLPFQYKNSVPNIDDDHIDPASLPEGCRKVQMAVQDFEHGTVNVDNHLIASLSHFEYGMLRLHETFLKLRNLPGTDTTPIRKAVAAVLDDPRLEFRKFALDLFAREKEGARYVPAYSPAQDFVNRHCQSRGMVAPGSILDGQCKMAIAKSNQEWEQADRAAAIPTLRHIPKTLDCEVTSELDRTIDWQPPKSFRLARAEGDGRPKSNNVYSLGFSSPMLKGLQSDNPQTMLWTERHKRQNEIGDIGSLRIGMSWVTAQGLHLTFILDEYQEITHEFLGDIYLVDETTSPGRGELPTKLAGYGLSCHSEDVEFGLDFDQSY
jgi:hypothetical protein